MRTHRLSAKKNFVVCFVYRAPSSPNTFCSDLHDVINNLTVKFPSMPLILLGDFNFPGINWQSEPQQHKQAPRNILNLSAFVLISTCTSLFLKPTRCSAQSPNILDLILTTSPEFVSPMTYLPGITDHFIIQCDSNLTLPSLTSSEVIHDYRCADFDAINNNELELFIADYIPSFHFRTVEENWSLFKEKATSLITQYIPQKRIYYLS